MPRTGRVGQASFDADRTAESPPERPAPVSEIARRILDRAEPLEDRSRRGDGLLDDCHVFRGRTRARAAIDGRAASGDATLHSWAATCACNCSRILRCTSPRSRPSLGGQFSLSLRESSTFATWPASSARPGFWMPRKGSHFRRVILAKLPRVLIHVNQADVVRHGRYRPLVIDVKAEEIHAPRRAQRRTHAAASVDLRARRPAFPARRVRMGARKGEPAVRRARFGEDGRSKQFGEFDQFLNGIALENATAGQDRRVFRLGQDFGRALQFVERWPYEWVDRPWRSQIEIPDFPLNVDRNRKKYRAGGRRKGRLDRPADGQAASRPSLPLPWPTSSTGVRRGPCRTRGSVPRI